MYDKPSKLVVAGNYVRCRFDDWYLDEDAINRRVQKAALKRWANKLTGFTVLSAEEVSSIYNDRHEEYLENKKNLRLAKNINRSRNNLITLALANFTIGDKFIRLSYAADVENLKQAYSDLGLFCKRLEYYIRKENSSFSLKYLAVPEIQYEREKKYGKGVWHFHIIANIPYLKKSKLEELWGHGFCHIEEIYDVAGKALYCAKYITKQQKDPRLSGQKSVTRSRNLYVPPEYSHDDAEKAYDALELKKIKPLHVRHEYNVGALGNPIGKSYWNEYILPEKPFDFYKDFISGVMS